MLCRRLLVCVLLLLALPVAAQLQPLEDQRPHLVLTIVVDQMRYDYLTRFGAEFTGGLKRLLSEGAVFTNANYDAAPTVTAIGHSTILSGATPSLSGIAGNSWYQRSEGKMVESITDDTVKALGGGSGASPKRLLVTTVGDELKNSGIGGKVYGVSLKNRSAILPAGRNADGAFWIVNGQYVSSSWYFDALPQWVAQLNASMPADRFAGMQFADKTMPVEPGKALYDAIGSTPFADEMVLDFALQLMQEERLGKGPATDLLSVSFSAMDYLGHSSGPDTEAMHQMVLSIDSKVGALLSAAEKQAGKGQVLVVFTADHGVSPIPEEHAEKRLPGGRYSSSSENAVVEKALVSAFGEADYIAADNGYALYLNAPPADERNISAEAMQEVAAAALRTMPHVARVYTREQLEQEGVWGDHIDRLIRNGFNPENSGDVIMVHEPNWLSGSSGTSHGSPYSYDTHVPMIFWGPRALVDPGLYHHQAVIQDIAPTLSTMLKVATPSGSVGSVQTAILVRD